MYNIDYILKILLKNNSKKQQCLGPKNKQTKNFYVINRALHLWCRWLEPSLTYTYGAWDLKIFNKKKNNNNK